MNKMERTLKIEKLRIERNEAIKSANHDLLRHPEEWRDVGVDRIKE